MPETPPRPYRVIGSAHFQIVGNLGLPQPFFVGRAIIDSPLYHARVHPSRPGTVIYYHCFSGALLCHDRGKSFPLSAGQGVLFEDTDPNLNLVFEAALAKRTEIAVFFMDGGEALLSMTRQIIGKVGRVFSPSIERGSILGRIFAWAKPVYGDIRLDPSEGLSMVTSVLAALVASGHTVKPSGDSVLVERARALLAGRGLSGASIASIAKELGMSREHFSRSFKSASGESPVDYIDRLRSEEAGRLLVGGEFTQTQIARQLGFKRLSSFQRAFQRSTGCLPGDYRRQHWRW